MSAMQIKSDNFETEVMNSEKLVLIDFWADWCMPCKMIAPAVEELAREYEGKVTVGKLNVDQEREIAIKFNIVSIPTIIFVKDGREVDRIIGAVPKSAIKEKLDKLI